MTLPRSSYSPSRGSSLLALGLVAACASADTRVDPGDLALRDLLGVAPATAVTWDSDERAAARRVLEAGLADDEPLGVEVALGAGVGLDERVARALAALDAERDGDGEPALGVVRAAVLAEPRALRVAATVRSPDDAAIDLRLGAAWDDAADIAGLPARAPAALLDLARRAGHRAGPVIAVPVPRLATVAAYVEPVLAEVHAGADGSAHLLVNPVLLAALEPEPGAPGAAAAVVLGARPAAGNPYSFYGSVAECAQAQRLRCEACVPTGDCVAITDSDGATECARLAEDGGRGYFLLCINLAIAITGVAECAADGAPACPRDEDASRSLAELAQNASFLDDAACSAVLDGCLADLYGEPDDDFPAPGGPDAGPAPAPAPRDTSAGCGDSSANCELSPSCDVSGPSCDDSVTCDGGCSDSSSQSGCDGTCDACESNDGSGGSCVSCESDDSPDSDGGSCESGDGGSSDGGSCDSGDGGGSDCGGGDCGGSDCGGSDCGSNGGCGDCDSGGSSGSCSVAHRRRPPAGLALTVALLWALLPVPLAARARRRARRARAGGGAR